MSAAGFGNIFNRWKQENSTATNRNPSNLSRPANCSAVTWPVSRER